MKLAVQTVVTSAVGVVVFCALLFWPAGTFGYWRAWVFIAVFAIVSTGPSLYWLVKRPEVLRRRMNAGPAKETRPAQKIAVTGVFVMFLGVIAFSAFDHRFGWSQVPAAVSVIGDVLVAIGLGIAMLVVQQNSYAAANVTVESGQEVVSTGLYGLVRHPMYTGATIMMVGIPLALGSYWGVAFVVPAVLILAVRIADEEAMLRQELPGYVEYQHKVSSRLVPYVW